jgi:hypothetical protein|tara:strand:+ start:574 stop:876 length:303 start_codon:yes stop_codon:yes gene_type:complete
MKKALVHGTRICEVHTKKTHKVVAPLSWQDVPNNTVADKDTWENGAVVKYKPPVLSYRQRRRKGYGPIGDQLDMQYWDSVNGTSVWRDHVAAVKAKYPKP